MRKTDRQIKNRLNVDAILSWHLAAGAGACSLQAAGPRRLQPSAVPCQPIMPVHVPRDRVPVAGARYTTLNVMAGALGFHYHVMLMTSKMDLVIRDRQRFLV